MHEGRSARTIAHQAVLSGWLPVLGWAALIFLVSAQPDLRVVPHDPFLDLMLRKLGHFVVFGILALLLLRALAGTPALRRRWALAWILTVLYALTDEVHQGFVPGRQTSVVDMGIDAAGALAFLLAARSIRARGARGQPEAQVVFDGHEAPVVLDGHG